jgi:hypothetical protein
MFTNFVEVRGESVLVGENEALEVRGKGNVRMRVGTENLVLKNVLLVPNIARNLLSTIAATRYWHCLPDIGRSGHLVSAGQDACDCKSVKE